MFWFSLESIIEIDLNYFYQRFFADPEYKYFPIFLNIKS